MRKIYLWPALWLVLITTLSLMPGFQLKSFNLFKPDKVGHALVYGILVWLLLRAAAQYAGRGHAIAREGWYAFLFAAGYGIFMEFVQGNFIPGRFFELDDMLANMIGAGAAAAWYFWRRR